MKRAFRVFFHIPFILISYLIPIMVALFYIKKYDFISKYTEISNYFFEKYYWIRHHVSSIFWILLLTYLIF
jgi:hypothetical protein